MTINIDEYLDEPEHDSRSHVGVPGVGDTTPPPAFGNGGLGDFVLNSLLETTGDLHYNTLTIQVAGVLTAVAERKLVVRVRGACVIDGALHADGRGYPGTAGGQGGDTGAADPGAASSPTPVHWGPSITGAPSGGAGGGLSGGTGASLDQNVHRRLLGSLGPTPPAVAGAASGAAGNSPVAIDPVEAARLAEDYALGYRSRSPLGQGGTGGAGGQSSFGGGTGGAGGAAGSRTGTGIGTGGAGVTGNPACGAGGGGGGAGGGHVELWCGDDLTVSGTGRISARGGSGGAGAGADVSSGFPGDGGGGAPGSGGLALAFYAGTLSLIGAVDANPGAVGPGGPGAFGSIAGFASGTAVAGYAAVQKVA